MSEPLKPFEAEVGRVLDLVINSLYTNKEIFLRELISNASDACDKLRYEAIAHPDLLGDEADLTIRIKPDATDGTLTISDNGIGMDGADLESHLGTIARSGTAKFLEAAKSQEKGNVNLIGQFGVGFYSAFMVADQVTVISRKAGSAETWSWQSDGSSGYRVEKLDESGPRGTTITLKLKSDEKEFLEEFRLRHIVRTYSNHVAFPILLEKQPEPKEGEEDEKPAEPEQLNDAGALWTKPKSDITDDQYREFYHHTAHAFDEPFTRIHFNVEGLLSYTGLLFVPSMKPFDLYDPKRSHGVKLFVKRVFISDKLEELLPRYLRFVSGVVDSEDLQLNVSRETLQHNAVVAKMKKALVKRLLDELARKAKEPAETEQASDDDSEVAQKTSYEAFWNEFGPVLKEGLYEDHDNRDRLLELARFRSTESDGWVSLEDYVSRMKEGQEAILTISGETIDALKGSPQLEAARAKGVEVLLLTDPVDEFWTGTVGPFKEKPFKSLTKDEVDLDQIGSADTQSDEAENMSGEEGAIDRLIAKLKLSLGDAVKDVRSSKRLTESAVCLVAEQGGMDMRMERFLKQHNQLDALSKRVLEINPKHGLVTKLAELAKNDGQTKMFDDMAQLLLDQARIVEGEPLPDPGAFSRRMSTYLAQAV
ncbi:MAG: molecular chaperone HtpG [Geminicoccaceae bacterium]